MSKNAFFSPLQSKRFSLVFSGQLLSDCGNWLDYIAIYTLLVYSWQLGPEAVAAQVVAAGLPWILLGPLISVWVDRFPMKLIFVTSDLLRAAIVICLFFTNSFWLLLILVFLKNTIATTFEASKMKAIRSFVHPDSLSQAVSLSQISVYLMKIVAPIAGGAIAAQTSSKIIFLIEGVLFFVSAILLSRLPREVSATQQSAEPSFFKELKGGIKHLGTTPTLLMGVLLISSSLFLIFLFEGLFVLWAKDQQLTEQAYGMLISAVGFGSLVGAFGGGKWTWWRNKPLLWMSGAIAISGLLVSFLGLGGILQISLPSIVWSVLAFVTGVCAAFTTVPFGYILQTETPIELIGRVSGSSNALQNVSTFTAPLLGAFLAKFFSTSIVFLGSGIGLIVLGIVVFVRIFVNLTLLSSKSREFGNSSSQER
jgi:MFS family permease